MALSPQGPSVVCGEKEMMASNRGAHGALEEKLRFDRAFVRMWAHGYWILGLGLILGGLPGAMPAAWEQEKAAPIAGMPLSSTEEAEPFFMEALPETSLEVPIRWEVPGHEAEVRRVGRPAKPPVGGIPERLVIPAIALDAPIVPAGSRIVSINGRRYREWLAPDREAAGWHPTSARAGASGNMVLSGHNNMAGAVFRRLADLKMGDRIWIYTRDRVFIYEVVELRILLERGQPLAVRQSNAQWIQPTPDERLTLVTCWPPWSNSHRLIVIAHPFSQPIGP